MTAHAEAGTAGAALGALPVAVDEAEELTGPVAPLLPDAAAEVDDGSPPPLAAFAIFRFLSMAERITQ